MSPLGSARGQPHANSSAFDSESADDGDTLDTSDETTSPLDGEGDDAGGPGKPKRTNPIDSALAATRSRRNPIDSALSAVHDANTAPAPFAKQNADFFAGTGPLAPATPAAPVSTPAAPKPSKLDAIASALAPAGPYAAENAKVFNPAPAPSPMPVAVARDVTVDPATAPARVHDHSDPHLGAAMQFGINALGLENPVEPIVGMAAALPNAIRVAGAPIKGQPRQPTYRPGTDEEIENQGAPAEPVTAKEKAIAAAQLVASVMHAPIAQGTEAAAAPLLERVAPSIAKPAAKLAGGVVAGAVPGAAFMPDHPVLGALLGGGIGGLHTVINEGTNAALGGGGGGGAGTAPPGAPFVDPNAPRLGGSVDANAPKYEPATPRKSQPATVKMDATEHAPVHENPVDVVINSIDEALDQAGVKRRPAEGTPGTPVPPAARGASGAAAGTGAQTSTPAAAPSTAPSPVNVTSPLETIQQALDQARKSQTAPVDQTPPATRELGEDLEGVKGRSDSVLLPGNKELAHDYMIVDAKDLTPSNSPSTFVPNSRYPIGVQGRAYHGPRGAAARQQVEIQTAQLNPKKLLDAGSSAEGPPVVTRDGIVVVGNQRTMMLQRALTAAPERMTEYRKQLRDRAPLFGLDAEDVDKVPNPVLVRRIQNDAIDHADVATLRELNRLSDTPEMKTKDPMSDASSRAKRLETATDALTHFSNTIEPDESIREYLDTAHGRTFITKLVSDGVIQPQELPKFVDVQHNTLTPHGKQLVEDTMLAAAVGDPDVASRAPVQMMKKIEHAVPSLVQTGRLPGYDLRPSLRGALDVLHAAKTSGMRAKDFLEQPDLMGRTFPPDVARLARFLDENKKPTVTDAFRKYATGALAATNHAQSEDIFGTPPESPKQLADRVFGKAPAAQGPVEDMPALEQQPQQPTKGFQAPPRENMVDQDGNYTGGYSKGTKPKAPHPNTPAAPPSKLDAIANAVNGAKGEKPARKPTEKQLKKKEREAYDAHLDNVRSALRRRGYLEREIADLTREAAAWERAGRPEHVATIQTEIEDRREDLEETKQRYADALTDARGALGDDLANQLQTEQEREYNEDHAEDDEGMPPLPGPKAGVEEMDAYAEELENERNRLRRSHKIHDELPEYKALEAQFHQHPFWNDYLERTPEDMVKLWLRQARIAQAQSGRAIDKARKENPDEPFLHYKYHALVRQSPKWMHLAYDAGWAENSAAYSVRAAKSSNPNDNGAWGKQRGIEARAEADYKKALFEREFMRAKAERGMGPGVTPELDRLVDAKKKAYDDAKAELTRIGEENRRERESKYPAKNENPYADEADDDEIPPSSVETQQGSRYEGEENPDALLEGAKDELHALHHERQHVRGVIDALKDDLTQAINGSPKKQSLQKKLNDAKAEIADVTQRYIDKLSEVRDAFGDDVADRVRAEVEGGKSIDDEDDEDDEGASPANTSPKPKAPTPAPSTPWAPRVDADGATHYPFGDNGGEAIVSKVKNADEWVVHTPGFKPARMGTEASAHDYARGVQLKHWPSATEDRLDTAPMTSNRSGGTVYFLHKAASGPHVETWGAITQNRDGTRGGQWFRSRDEAAQRFETWTGRAPASPIAGSIKPNIPGLIDAESESLEGEGTKAPGPTFEDAYDRLSPAEQTERRALVDTLNKKQAELDDWNKSPSPGRRVQFRLENELHDAQIKLERFDKLHGLTAHEEPEGTGARPQGVQKTMEEEGDRASRADIGTLMNKATELLDAGKPLPKGASNLRKWAEDVLGRKYETRTWKMDDVYDAIEGAVNGHALDHLGTAYYGDQPRLDEARNIEREYFSGRLRSADQRALQQFSTPIQIARAAQIIAGVRPTDKVLEPTAGTGNLVNFIRDPERVDVNELDPRRRTVLEGMGFKPTGEDALKLPLNGKRYNVVIMNPPFGSASTGRFKGFEATPFDSSDIAQRFVAAALSELVDGGRLVAVMPMNTFKAKGFRDWLAANHTPVALIASPEGEYKTRGTEYGSAILVVDKGATPNARLATYDDLDWEQWKSAVDLFAKGGKLARTRGLEPAKDVAAIEQPQDKRPAGPKAEAPLVDRGHPNTDVQSEGGPRGSRSEPHAATDSDLAQGSRSPSDRTGGAGEGSVVRPEGPESERGPGAGPRADVGHSDVVAPERTGGGDRSAETAASTVVPSLPRRRMEPEEGDSPERRREIEAANGSHIFAPFARGTAERRSPHPRLVVETRAMAGMPAPGITAQFESPHVNAAWGRAGAKGGLSDEQADAVGRGLTAWDKGHGFLAADDVGVGKTREAAALVLEAIARGAKRILYLTKNENNVQDAQAEFKLVASGDESGAFPALFASVGDYKGVKAGVESLPMPDQPIIYFAHSYNFAPYGEALKEVGIDTLIGDEAHEYKNVGSNRGMAWTALHEDILKRKGRFAYFTATPGVTLDELGYLFGLREWPVGGFADWVDRKLGKKGEESSDDAVDAADASEAETVAMGDRTNVAGGAKKPKLNLRGNDVFTSRVTPAETEQIMRELKGKGKYIARDLWRGGVKFDVHTVDMMGDSPEAAQNRARYNQAAEFARDLTNAARKFGLMNKKVKTSGAYRAALQSYMKQLLFSMRLPTVLAEADKALKNGQQVVISVHSVTGDEDLEEGMSSEDSTKSVNARLLSAINDINTQHVEKEGKGEAAEYVDLGTIPEALIVRASLLERAKALQPLPDPIRLIEERFGPKNVAVITGQRNPKQRKIAMGDFQKGTRKVALISKAGKVGISLHDVNGKQRRMFVADYEWSADTFKQELGRVDRTGQVSSPHVTLVASNMAAERKFAATIAARMASLGATSKGSAESTGTDALDQFDVSDSISLTAMRAAVEDLDDATREYFTGRKFLERMKDKDNGDVFVPKHTPDPETGVKDFLLDVMMFPVKEADLVYKLWMQKRDELRTGEDASAAAARRTARGKAKVLRTTELARPGAPRLTMYELENANGEKTGVLQGFVTSYIAQIQDARGTTEGGTQKSRRYVQITTPDGELISGLELNSAEARRVKDLFGAGKTHITADDALADLATGDKVPVQGPGGARFILHTRRDGRVAITGATVTKHLQDLNGYARYEPVGSFFHVPNNPEALKKFLDRFPPEQPGGKVGEAGDAGEKGEKAQGFAFEHTGLLEPVQDADQAMELYRRTQPLDENGGGAVGEGTKSLDEAERALKDAERAFFDYSRTHDPDGGAMAAMDTPKGQQLLERVVAARMKRDAARRGGALGERTPNPESAMKHEWNVFMTPEARAQMVRGLGFHQVSGQDASRARWEDLQPAVKDALTPAMDQAIDNKYGADSPRTVAQALWKRIKELPAEARDIGKAFRENDDLFGGAGAPDRSKVINFHSGASRAADIRGLTDAGKHVGVAANELSESGIAELERLAGTGTNVFLDSGAFSETPEKPITDREWQKRLTIADRLADKLGAQLHVVAPDKVGDAAATLERLTKYAPELQAIKKKGAKIIVPVQTGGVSHSPERAIRFYEAATDALHFKPVAGLPMNKAAMTAHTAEWFVRGAQPRGVHLLGMGENNRRFPALLHRLQSVAPGLAITQDANALRANVGKTNGVAGGERPLTRNLRETKAEGHEEAFGATEGEFGEHADYTDEISEPEHWTTPADRRRIARDADLSKNETERFVVDPSSFLQEPHRTGDIKRWEDPHMEQALNDAWIRHLDDAMSQTTKAEAVRRTFIGAGKGDAIGEAGDEAHELAERPTFYSRLERAIAAAPFAKGTGQQWAATLTKNVAKGEREWTGVEEYLQENADKVLTRDQVANVFNKGKVSLDETSYEKFDREDIEDADRALQYAGARLRDALEDVGLANSDMAKFNANNGRYTPEAYAEYIRKYSLHADRNDPKRIEAVRSAAEALQRAQARYDKVFRDRPQYEAYTEPGGDGYRELVVSVPPKDGATHDDLYTTGHFPKVTNPVFHIRTKVRTVNGKRYLFGEEIQSDGHQEGREKGYREKLTPAKRAEVQKQFKDVQRELDEVMPRLHDLNNLQRAHTDAEREEERTLRNRATRLDMRSGTLARSLTKGVAAGGVPDLPFKKTEEWAGLALRRLIDEAVQNGYDGIGWTTGAQQAARYDLSKHVDRLEYEPSGRFRALRNGRDVHTGHYDAKALPSVIGKETAQKLLATEPVTRPFNLGEDPNAYNLPKMRVLEGAGLKIGGHGMLGFYDEILPGLVRDYAKKMGVKLALEPLDIHGKNRWVVYDPDQYRGDENGVIHFYSSEEAAEDARAQNWPEFEVGQLPDSAVVTDREAVQQAYHGLSNIPDGSEPSQNAMDVLQHLAYQMLDLGERSLEKALPQAMKDAGVVTSVRDVVKDEVMELIEDARSKLETIGNAQNMSFTIPPELAAKVAAEGQMLWERQLRQATTQLGMFDATRDGKSIDLTKLPADEAHTQSPAQTSVVERITQKVAELGMPKSGARVRQIQAAAKRNMIDPVGREMKTVTQKAELMKAFRHPAMEILHAFVLDDHGIVRGHLMATSGEIHWAAIPHDFAARVLAMMDQVGANNVEFGHNHPSGNVLESQGDIASTHLLQQTIEAQGKKVLGHTIINHDQATRIVIHLNGKDGRSAPQAEISRYKIDADKNAPWKTSAQLGTPQLRHDYQKVNYLARVTAPDALTLAFLDSNRQVLAIAPRLASSAESLHEWLPQAMKAHAARYVVIAAPDAIAHDIADRASRAIGSSTNEVNGMPAHDESTSWAFPIADVVSVKHSEATGAPLRATTLKGDIKGFYQLGDAEIPQPGNKQLRTTSLEAGSPATAQVARAAKLRSSEQRELGPDAGVDMRGRGNGTALQEPPPNFGPNTPSPLPPKPTALEQIKDPLERAIAKFKGAGQTIEAVFNPAGVTDDAGKASRIVRHHRAVSDREIARMHNAVKAVRAELDKLDPGQLFDGPRWDFWKDVEQGLAPSHPSGDPAKVQALADLAKVLRDQQDHVAQQIHALGPGHMDHFIENYMARVYLPLTGKKRAMAARMFGSARPFLGPRGFKKARTQKLLEDSINAALTIGRGPPTDNPLDMHFLKIREMRKYLMGQRIIKEMKKAKLLKFLRARKPMPDGYAAINSKDFIVRAGFDSEGAQRTRGQYIAPVDVARILNNFLSPGLRGNPIYDSYSFMGSMLNGVQLGLSAFHANFTSWDATVQNAVLGYQQIVHGAQAGDVKKVAQGAGNMALAGVSAATAPFTVLPLPAAVKTYLQGNQVWKAYFADASTAEMQRVIDGLLAGGGRARMDEYYRAGALKNVRAAFHDKQWVKMGLNVPFAAIEASMWPLLEHIVPRMKLGAIYGAVQIELAKLPPNATIDDFRTAAARVVDQVDARMGQMIYDNRFWHRVTKEILMAGIRSPGWQVGNFDVTIGAGAQLVGNAVGAADDARRKLLGSGNAGTPPNKTPRQWGKVQYMVALAGLVAMYGAIKTYLNTGDLPGDVDGKFQGRAMLIHDLYFPRNGRKDGSGNWLRDTPATYVKDVFSLYMHPLESAMHRFHPLLNAFSEMLENRDFYGDMIHDEDPTHFPYVTQGAWWHHRKQDAQWFEHEGVKPFSVRNWEEVNKRGGNLSEKIHGALGEQAASREIVRTPAQNQMAKYLNLGGHQVHSPEEKDAADERHVVAQGLRDGSATKQNIIDLELQGKATRRQGMQMMRDRRKVPLEEQFRHLTLPQAEDVYAQGQDWEKKLWWRDLRRLRLRDRLNRFGPPPETPPDSTE